MPRVFVFVSLAIIVIEQIMQVLAADRLSELHEAQEENRVLSEQLQDLQVYKLKFHSLASGVDSL